MWYVFLGASVFLSSLSFAACPNLLDAFSKEKMVHWIDQQTAFGPRRSGSPSGQANEQFLADELIRIGVKNVHLEPIPVEHWEPKTTSFRVEQTDGVQDVPIFPIPYTAFTPKEGVTAPLMYASPTQWVHWGEDWKAKIVVTEIGFPDLNAGLLMRFASGKYDPDNNLAEVNHPATWVRLGWHLYHEAVKRGAAGFIGILKDQPGGEYRMWAPYGFREADILAKPVPAGWVSREGAPALLAAARAGRSANLLSVGERYPSVAHNIVGEIPGRTKENQLLHSHSDSPFISPTEDASGVSVILAASEFLAKEAAAGRPLNRTVTVLLTTGHFYGSIGTRQFIRDHANEVDPAFEISVEHVANEAVIDERGRAVAGTRPEPVAAFTLFNRTVNEAVVAAVSKHGLARTIVLPGQGLLGPIPPTDGGDWAEARALGAKRRPGLVNFISNPFTLLVETDAMPFVATDRLTKTAAVVTELLYQLDKTPREQLSRVDNKFKYVVMRVLGWMLRMKTTLFGLHPTS